MFFLFYKHVHSGEKFAAAEVTGNCCWTILTPVQLLF